MTNEQVKPPFDEGLPESLEQYLAFISASDVREDVTAGKRFEIWGFLRTKAHPEGEKRPVRVMGLFSSSPSESGQHILYDIKTDSQNQVDLLAINDKYFTRGPGGSVFWQYTRVFAKDLGDPNWRHREASRDYTPTVISSLLEQYLNESDCDITPTDSDLSLYSMFLHVALKDPSKVAYTPNEEAGRTDRQLVTTPGRFLQKHFGDRLDADTIRAWSDKHMLAHADLSVKFASTQQDIQAVYENGPRSCMGGAGANFDSSIHPCRVYAAGDLEIAYLGSIDSRVTARAVVWPAKKVYSTVYGDSKLEDLLCDLGYRDGGLQGAKLLKLKDPGSHRYIMPYIDDSQAVEDGGDVFVINSDGDISADRVDGYCGELEVCHHCGDTIHEDDRREDENGHYYHSDCYYEVYSICESCGDEVDNDNVTTNHCGEVICERCLDRYYVYCEHSGEYYPASEMVTVRVRDGIEENWHQNEAYDHAFCCPECDGWFAYRCGHEYSHTHNTITEDEITDGDTICRSCGDYKLEKLEQASIDLEESAA